MCSGKPAQSLIPQGFPLIFVVHRCPRNYTRILNGVGNQSVTENKGHGEATAVAVRNARERIEGAYFLSDGDGLRLRVAQDGSKVWQVRYFVNDKERTYTLPRPYGPKTDDAHLSLEGARDQARIIKAYARDGIDYQNKRSDEIEAQDKERKVKQSQALTVRNLFEAWHEEIATKRGSTGRKDGALEVRRTQEKDVLPHLGDTLLVDLTRDAVLKVMRRVSDRGHNRLAVVMLRDFKQMLRYGEKSQPWKRLLVECDALSIDDEHVIKGDYDNERTRVLEDDEVKALKDLIPASGMTAVVQAALWVMLSVGTRVGETVAARWEHVDFNTRTWFIPKENTKTQAAFTVFMSDFTLAIFQELHAVRMARDENKRSDFVFPSRTSALKPLDCQTVGKALRDRQRPDGKPIKGRTESVDALVLSGGVWKCHDLRRTAGTLMQKCGVSPETIHRCLNHAPPTKLDRIYLQYDYSEEMAAAWDKLSEKLCVLLAKNVIPVDFQKHAS
jgi:integrase